MSRAETQYGGGIRNYGEITVSAGAQLYNNHALMAGDDIYNGTYQRRRIMPMKLASWSHIVLLSLQTWNAAVRLRRQSVLTTETIGWMRMLP